MKKAVFLLAVVCIVLAGCVTSQSWTQVELKGKIEQIVLIEKDFVVVGIVFVTSSATLNTDEKIIEGSPVTYEMLLKEAKKLGADDIANLRIDIIKKPVTSTYTYPISGATSTDHSGNSNVTYNATALAIKYINKN